MYNVNDLFKLLNFINDVLSDDKYKESRGEFLLMREVLVDVIQRNVNTKLAYEILSEKEQGDDDDARVLDDSLDNFRFQF